MAIPLNKPFLPPKREYDNFLNTVWESSFLTNNGPLVQQLEKELKSFLKVKHLFLVSNCTTGLEIAVQAMGKKGEIITSPFSYVAAPSAILGSNCKPVYVDIDPFTFGMNLAALENAIVPETVAIFPTHLYGESSDVNGILNIAKKKNIPVIWDAAHTFGSLYDRQSVVSFGDISVISFHAYKIFHTIEGGAIITDNDEYAEKIYELRYFGLNRQNEFVTWGKNAKMNEFQAAMGLANLKYFPEILSSRKKIAEKYKMNLRNSSVRFPAAPPESTGNHSYLALIFETEIDVLNVKSSLEAKKIQSRRYFHPSLNQLKIHGNYSVPMPHSDSAASRVLCLPCYFGITDDEINYICNAIREALLK